MAALLSPFLIFFIGAVLVFFTGPRLRRAISLAIPLLSLWVMFGLPEGDSGTFELIGQTLVLHRVDSISTLFGLLFHIAAFIAILFSLHLDDRSQQATGIIYAGSAIGAVFAGDLLSLFLFWEILALSSVFLIWARGGRKPLMSGFRYLIWQILSGVLVLAGALLVFAKTGDLSVRSMVADGQVAGLGGWFLLIGFGIKAGFPLLHNWIIDAYPEATPTGTVFLVSFTTKVAIYALVRTFAGLDMLIYVGVVMALFPIFWAVIENDLRRVLSYSVINQLGFMVCGIGLGTELAINGAVAHAFADVLFKGVLMMSMGAVLLRAGTVKATELGGLAKSMPWTAGLCIVGAASISAFPLFSAFVTKSMIMVALADQHHTILWILMLAASAGVLEHAGIKIPYFAFFAHDSGKRPPEAPLNMLLAMAIGAAACIGIGVFPNLLYQWLPFNTGYSPYDLTHVVTQMQLLLFAILGVVLLHKSGFYPDEIDATNVDSDVIYRRWASKTIAALGVIFVPLWNGTKRLVWKSGARLGRGLTRSHGPEGLLADTWPTGSMVLWVGILLAVFLGFALF